MLLFMEKKNVCYDIPFYIYIFVKLELIVLCYILLIYVIFRFFSDGYVLFHILILLNNIR